MVLDTDNSIYGPQAAYLDLSAVNIYERAA